MTSAENSDWDNNQWEGIEIISLPVQPETSSQLFSPIGTTFEELAPLDGYRPKTFSERSTQTKKERRIARVVAVVGSGLLLMSFLLVGVTLSMSDHIDEMVRRANRPVGTRTKSSSFTYWPPSRSSTNRESPKANSTANNFVADRKRTA